MLSLDGVKYLKYILWKSGTHVVWSWHSKKVTFPLRKSVFVSLDLTAKSTIAWSVCVYVGGEIGKKGRKEGEAASLWEEMFYQLRFLAYHDKIIKGVEKMLSAMHELVVVVLLNLPRPGWIFGRCITFGKRQLNPKEVGVAVVCSLLSNIHL